LKKGFVGSVVTGIVIVLIIICGFACTERVPAGYVGVVYNMSGGVTGETLNQGWHIVSPTKNVTLYSIGIEQSYLTSDSKGDSKEDESFSTPTADGKSLTVDLEFSYKYDINRVTDVFTQFKGASGKEVKDIFIKPKMIAWTQEVTAKYPVTDVFGDKRQELNEALDTYLKEKFDKYGIVIDTVNFTNISTDPETQEAIQKKVNAQQELELAKIQKQTAKVDAEKEKEVAQINAEKAKIEAQGKADAELIKANAEAEANKKIAESLTDKLIEKTKYDKWNGELPYIEGAATPIINIKEAEKTE
jgi:regulator of protease activity HflC (stomatin/prohibitin superfamily)